MSRRPIQVETRALKTPRERIWACIERQAEDFTARSVRDLAKPSVNLSQCRDYLVGLEKGGYIVRQGARGKLNAACLDAVHYRLAKPQHDAPRVGKDGKPVSQGTATEAMWRAMKVLKTFDYVEVAKSATLGTCIVAPAAAQSYVNTLARAGYLTVVRPSKPGTPARLRLTKNTGPHAPAITRRKCVFDRNTGEFAELETAQEVCDGTE